MTEASAFEKALKACESGAIDCHLAAHNGRQNWIFAAEHEYGKARVALLAQHDRDIAAAVAERDARIRALEEALRPFGDCALAFNLSFDDEHSVIVNLVHLRRARAALATGEHKSSAKEA